MAKSFGKNGNRAAQAMLGNMLLKGDGVLRQAPLGLFWLMLANDGDGSVREMDRRNV